METLHKYIIKSFGQWTILYFVYSMD